MTTQEKVNLIKKAGWDVQEMVPGQWKIEQPYSEEDWDPMFFYGGEEALNKAVIILQSSAC